MKWNKQFIIKDSFEAPFLKEGREPKLFQFFPEAKNEIIKFCSEGVKSGCLSSEAVRSEIRNVIVPNCYSNLIMEAGGDSELMPSYEELLFNLDLTSICISTLWRWMILLGYKYNENRTYNYTDGHERPDVVF